MKVAISKTSAHRSTYVNKLKDLMQGIKSLGDEATMVVGKIDPTKHDTAVIYGSFKEYRKAPHHQIKKEISNTFRSYVQFETPVIGRDARLLDHEYVRVGVNGFLWDEARWGFEHTDKERYKKVLKECDIDIDKGWRKSGDHVLICMQNPGDASLRGKDVFEWSLETVEQLKKHTDRKIRIRPHPLPRSADIEFYKKLQDHKSVEVVENELPDKLRPLREDFDNAWCTITYSSGSAVDSVLAGIPNIACDRGNMAWDVSSHSLSDVENPYVGDKIGWLQKISMCQFNKEELRNGVCWKHIRKSI